MASAVGHTWPMRTLLVFYFLLLPFQWALSPAPGFDVAIIRVGTIVLFGMWLLVGLVRRDIRLSPGFTSGALLTFLLLAILSILWSESEAFALRKSIFLLNFLPLFFVLADIFSREERARQLVVRTVVLGATALGGVAILLFVAQFMFGVSAMVAFLSWLLPWFLGGTFGEAVVTHSSFLVNISGITLLRATGVLPDPHMLAFFMGMTAPLALALSFLKPSQSTFYRLAFGVLFIADLLTFSRGGYVGLVCGGLLFLIVARKSLFSPAIVKRGLVVALLLFLVLAVTPIGERLSSSFSSADGSNQERLRLWREGAVLIGERPLLGLGLGNYPLRVKPGALYREPIYAHNLYLDLALELGLIGLGAFLLAVLTPGIQLLRRWKESRDPLALAVGISLAVFLAHAFFETPLFSVHILPLLLLLLALGVSYKHDTTHASSGDVLVSSRHDRTPPGGSPQADSRWDSTVRP